MRFIDYLKIKENHNIDLDNLHRAFDAAWNSDQDAVMSFLRDMASRDHNIASILSDLEEDHPDKISDDGDEIVKPVADSNASA